LRCGVHTDNTTLGMPGNRTEKMFSSKIDMQRANRIITQSIIF